MFHIVLQHLQVEIVVKLGNRSLIRSITNFTYKNQIKLNDLLRIETRLIGSHQFSLEYGVEVSKLINSDYVTCVQAFCTTIAIDNFSNLEFNNQETQERIVYIIAYFQVYMNDPSQAKRENII